MIFWLDAQFPPGLAAWLSLDFLVEALALVELGLRDADDVQPDAELLALVTREMSGSFTVESGPIEGTRIRIRPGLYRQAIRLPSPQPRVMLVAEAR